jgi:molybdate transport system substrate-binding protein
MMKAQIMSWVAVALLCGVAGCGRGETVTKSPHQQPANGPTRETGDVVGEKVTDQENHADTVFIFAAASTTDALNEIRDSFRDKHRVTIRTNYAATPTLAQQIVNGAAADVFVSASSKWVETLANQNLVAERRDMLGNELVLIVPIGTTKRLEKLEGLLEDEVKHVALGDPESVPAGIYAKQALTKLDLWERLKSKVVSGADVRQALSFVETGAAEAGIVYATDAAVSKRVEITARIDPGLSDPIRYPVILLRNGADNPTARQFYDYLASEEASTVFRKFGFVVFD